jgi:hypothetical protein
VDSKDNVTTIVLKYHGMRCEREVVSFAGLRAMADEHGIRLTSFDKAADGRIFHRGVVDSTNGRAKFFVEHRVDGELVSGYRLPGMPGAR